MTLHPVSVDIGKRQSRMCVNYTCRGRDCCGVQRARSPNSSKCGQRSARRRYRIEESSHLQYTAVIMPSGTPLGRRRLNFCALQQNANFALCLPVVWDGHCRKEIHQLLIDECDLNPSALLPHIKGERSPQPVKSFDPPLLSYLRRLTHPVQPPSSVWL